MAPSSPVTPGKGSRTPKSPNRHKRGSLQNAFPDLSIARPVGSPSPTRPRRISSLLQGSFSEAYPPQGLGSVRRDRNAAESQQRWTLRMSTMYRYYDDDKGKWRTDSSVKEKDTEADVSKDFAFLVDVVTQLGESLDKGLKNAEPEDLEQALEEEIALAIYGSNRIEQVGPGLNETRDLCLAVFRGEDVDNLQYTKRSKDYQARLDAFTARGLQKDCPGALKVLRSRREVVQHAAAFQHIVRHFVREGRPMTEKLICNTHKILVSGVSADDSGHFNNKPYGGVYRTQRAWVGGGFECPKPGSIKPSMARMIVDLNKDLSDARTEGVLDPFILAAKYCSRLVYTHPFKDGNGRICRLLMNAILIKYAGIAVPLGEEGLDRLTYLDIVAESRKVGGHHGQLGTLLVRKAKVSVTRLRSSFNRRVAKKVNPPNMLVTL